MNYSELLKHYLDYAEKYYPENDVTNINIYFSSIEKYLYPKIEEVDKSTLKESISSLSTILMNRRGFTKYEVTKNLLTFYHQFTQYIYQKDILTTDKYIKDLSDEYVSSNSSITGKEKLYLKKLVKHINSSHLEKTNILKLKSVMQEHIKDYIEIYPDEDSVELNIYLTSIIDDFEEFIKREGVNSLSQ